MNAEKFTNEEYWRDIKKKIQRESSVSDITYNLWFDNLEFIELNACSGGCVGGVLTVENPYVAKVKLNKLRKYLPVAGVHNTQAELATWTKEVEYEPVFKLGSNMTESLRLMAKVDRIAKRFPGIDCGSCGAPSCHALAEDIVRGLASENDCIHIMREYLEKLSEDGVIPADPFCEYHPGEQKTGIDNE